MLRVMWLVNRKENLCMGLQQVSGNMMFYDHNVLGQHSMIDKGNLVCPQTFHNDGVTPH